MLIDIPYKNGDVISLKLASGEEVVARLQEEKGSELIVVKPMMVAATQEGLGLAPFMFSVAPDSKFTIKLSNVLCVIKTEEGFAKQYLEGTTGVAV